MDRKRKQIISWNLLLCLWLGLNGCRPEKPKFGPEFNPIRRKVGLPIIRSDARFEHMALNERPGEKFFVWGASQSGQDKNAGRGTDAHRQIVTYGKSVHYQDKPVRMLYEEDSYAKLGDKWIMPDDIDKTEDFTWLKTRYYFVPYSDRHGREHHEPGWECELNDREHHFTKGGPLRITLAQADSVLHAWGVDRLDP